MYNSDTVYSTTTFRPVSTSPYSIPATVTPVPQRTRKLETPLHFDGGLFSDIRSTEGKLLSKVTVDRVHSSTRHDVTDAPFATQTSDAHGNKDYVDDIVKTETIINEDVIKVKFTPVPFELDSVVLQRPRPLTPVKYLKDDFEDLQSYKIVNSLFKDKFLNPSDLSVTDNKSATASPVMRGHSPLANLIVAEHLTKIDGYLQESLNLVSESHQNIRNSVGITLSNYEVELPKVTEEVKETNNESIVVRSNKDNYKNSNGSYNDSPDGKSKTKSKLNSVEAKQPGVLSAIYNMPMHYHAAVLCFLLIVYNLVYQYIKQNCHGKNQTVS